MLGRGGSWPLSGLNGGYVLMRARLHIWDEPLLDGGGGGKEGLIDTIGKHMRGHLASHSQLGDFPVIAGIILRPLRFNTRTLE